MYYLIKIYAPRRSSDECDVVFLIVNEEDLEKYDYDKIIAESTDESELEEMLRFEYAHEHYYSYY